MQDYEIEEMLEQTQRFVTYKAINPSSGRRYLLKRYLVDETSGIGRLDGWQEKFMRLVDTFTSVEDPCLRSLIAGGIDEVDGNPYVVFEWMESSTLEDLMQEGFPVHLTEEINKSLFQVLDTLHSRGYLHGELTPSSVLYTDAKGKNPWIVKWCPIHSIRSKYGKARAAHNAYTAPEIKAGGDYSIQGDIFSVGQVISGLIPAEKKKGEVKEWLDLLTAVDPGERPQDAKKASLFCPDLSGEEENVLLSPESPAEEPSKPVFNTGAPLMTAASAAPAPTQAPTPASSPPAYAKPNYTPQIITICVLLLAIVGAFSFLAKKKGGEEVAQEEEYYVEYDEEKPKLEVREVDEEIPVSKEKSQVEAPVETEPALELPEGVCLPTEVPRERNLKNGTPMKVQGKVTNVTFPNDGKTILAFFRPGDAAPSKTHFTLEMSGDVFFIGEKKNEIKEALIGKVVRAAGGVHRHKKNRTYTLKVKNPQSLQVLN